MERIPLAIMNCAMLTPLDGACGAEGKILDSWRALGAGMCVKGDRGQAGVAEGCLAGDGGLDRSIRLALAVARKALEGVEGFDSRGGNDGTALFCGTSKGPVLTMLGALEKIRAGGLPDAAQARQMALGVGAMGAVLGGALGIRRVHTSVAACASGLFALHRARRAILCGECERALVVAADASLHPLFEGSFERLGVLAPRGPDGVRRCEPFGEDGGGFFLSEAAAVVVVERTDAATRRKTDAATGRRGDAANGGPAAFLESTWVGGDSTGLIAADPGSESLRRGLGFCIQESLAASPFRRVAAPGLSFIHAHAAGTAHDARELAAIRSVAGEAPHVFSIKGQLGHSLGAAGLVSLVVSIFSHHHGATPCGKPVAPSASSLTIAQGFGGHIAIARLRGR